MSIKKILKEYDNFDWINDINPISPHIENIVGKKLRHRDNNLAHIANHNDLSKIKDGGVLLLKPKMDYYFVVDRIDRITNEGIIKIFPKRKSRYKQEEVRYSVSDMENLIRLGVWVLDDSIEESDNTIVEESGEEIEPIEKEIDYIEKEYGWLTGETKFDTMTSGITNKDVFKAKYILTNEIKKNNSFVYLYKNFLEFLNKVNTILGTDIKIKEDTFTTMTGRNSENTKDVYGLSDEQIKKWKEVKRNNARVVGQKNLRQPKTQEEIDTNLTKLIDYLTKEELSEITFSLDGLLEKFGLNRDKRSNNEIIPKKDEIVKQLIGEFEQNLRVKFYLNYIGGYVKVDQRSNWATFVKYSKAIKRIIEKNELPKQKEFKVNFKNSKNYIKLKDLFEKIKEKEYCYIFSDNCELSSSDIEKVMDFFGETYENSFLTKGFKKDTNRGLESRIHNLDAVGYNFSEKIKSKDFNANEIYNYITENIKNYLDNTETIVKYDLLAKGERKDNKGNIIIPNEGKVEVKDINYLDSYLSEFLSSPVKRAEYGVKDDPKYLKRYNEVVDRVYTYLTENYKEIIISKIQEGLEGIIISNNIYVPNKKYNKKDNIKFYLSDIGRSNPKKQRRITVRYEINESNWENFYIIDDNGVLQPLDEDTKKVLRYKGEKISESNDIDWIKDAYKTEWTFDDIAQLYYAGDVEAVKIVRFKDLKHLRGAIEWCLGEDVELGFFNEFKVGSIRQILSTNLDIDGQISRNNFTVSDLDCGWCLDDPDSIGYNCNERPKTMSLRIDGGLIGYSFAFSEDWVELEPIMKSDELNESSEGLEWIRDVVPDDSVKFDKDKLYYFNPPLNHDEIINLMNRIPNESKYAQTKKWFDRVFGGRAPQRYMTYFNVDGGDRNDGKFYVSGWCSETRWSQVNDEYYPYSEPVNGRDEFFGHYKISEEKVSDFGWVKEVDGALPKDKPWIIFNDLDPESIKVSLDIQDFLLHKQGFKWVNGMYTKYRKPLLAISSVFLKNQHVGIGYHPMFDYFNSKHYSEIYDEKLNKLKEEFGDEFYFWSDLKMSNISESKDDFDWVRDASSNPFYGTDIKLYIDGAPTLEQSEMIWNLLVDAGVTTMKKVRTYNRVHKLMNNGGTFIFIDHDGDFMHNVDDLSGYIENGRISAGNVLKFSDIFSDDEPDDYIKESKDFKWVDDVPLTLNHIFNQLTIGDELTLKGNTYGAYLNIQHFKYTEPFKITIQSIGPRLEDSDFKISVREKEAIVNLGIKHKGELLKKYPNFHVFSNNSFFPEDGDLEVVSWVKSEDKLEESSQDWDWAETPEVIIGGKSGLPKESVPLGTKVVNSDGDIFTIEDITGGHMDFQHVWGSDQKTAWLGPKDDEDNKNWHNTLWLRKATSEDLNESENEWDWAKNIVTDGLDLKFSEGMCLLRKDGTRWLVVDTPKHASKSTTLVWLQRTHTNGIDITEKKRPISPFRESTLSRQIQSGDITICNKPLKESNDFDWIDDIDAVDPKKPKPGYVYNWVGYSDIIDDDEVLTDTIIITKIKSADEWYSGGFEIMFVPESTSPNSEDAVHKQVFDNLVDEGQIQFLHKLSTDMVNESKDDFDWARDTIPVELEDPKDWVGRSFGYGPEIIDEMSFAEKQMGDDEEYYTINDIDLNGNLSLTRFHPNRPPNSESSTSVISLRDYISNGRWIWV